MGLMGSFHCVGKCVGPHLPLMLPVRPQQTRKKNLCRFFFTMMGQAHLPTASWLVLGFWAKGLYVFGCQQRLSIMIGIHYDCGNCSYTLLKTFSK